MKEKTIEIDNRKVSYRIGENHPVTLLLVHGFGVDGSLWDEQITFFSNKARLLIPDLPGSGKSSADNDGLLMEGYAEILRKIILREGIKEVVMIGHSMGGYITLAFAEKYPELLKGFGLFHSSATADTDEKKATRKKGIEFTKQHGAFAFLKTVIPNMFAPKTQETKPQLIEQQIAKASNFSNEAVVSYYEAMMQRPDRTPLLVSADVPVLFLMGEHDQILPLKDILKQCSLPKKSYIQILHESGHLGMREETNKTNQFLEEYIKLIQLDDFEPG